MIGACSENGAARSSLGRATFARAAGTGTGLIANDAHSTMARSPAGRVAATRSAMGPENDSATSTKGSSSASCASTRVTSAS